MRFVPCKTQLRTQCRRLTTTASLQPVAILPDATIETFRQAYHAGRPVLLPRDALSSLPAIKKWFVISQQPNAINASYLAKYGSVSVPLEFTNGQTFARIQQPLSYFLECLAASSSQHSDRSSRYFSSYVPGARAVHRTKRDNTFFSKEAPTTPTTQIYLAQAPITDLPRALRADIPTPHLVTEADKGDVYDSSIWIGQPPTYTPLHKDPNPNLFVQLAGSKSVRLYKPDVGRGIFAKVQEMVGGNASHAIRGEEMMQGAERAALEQEIWVDNAENHTAGYEAKLNSGDALFIPKGWWHSIKSSGTGINGSVGRLDSDSVTVSNAIQANWWFR